MIFFHHFMNEGCHLTKQPWPSLPYLRLLVCILNDPSWKMLWTSAEIRSPSCPQKISISLRWTSYKDLQVLSHTQLIFSPSSAKLTTRKINWAIGHGNWYVMKYLQFQSRRQQVKPEERRRTPSRRDWMSTFHLFCWTSTTLPTTTSPISPLYLGQHRLHWGDHSGCVTINEMHLVFTGVTDISLLTLSTTPAKLAHRTLEW